MRRAGRAATLLLILLAPSGCGSTDDLSPSRTDGQRGLAGTVTVLAAASLTGAFTELGRDFEAAHPGTKVSLGFGASSGLATSITGGAPADVFASAGQKAMDVVTEAGLAGSGTAFARNVMEIAVPPRNRAGVSSLADLTRPGVKVALCQAQVPCGAVAATVLANAGLTLAPVSLEADVKAVLTRVQLDEVDAGVVYVTDVRAAGDTVKGIEIPAAVNASTTYPIAALDKAPNPALARAFVAWVLSAPGQKALTDAGFTSP